MLHVTEKAELVQFDKESNGPKSSNVERMWAILLRRAVQTVLIRKVDEDIPDLSVINLGTPLFLRSISAYTYYEPPRIGMVQRRGEGVRTLVDRNGAVFPTVWNQFVAIAERTDSDISNGICRDRYVERVEYMANCINLGEVFDNPDIFLAVNKIGPRQYETLEGFHRDWLTRTKQLSPESNPTPVSRTVDLIPENSVPLL